eukprot:7226037-Prymnesium_polylepis.1
MTAHPPSRARRRRGCQRLLINMCWPATSVQQPCEIAIYQKHRLNRVACDARRDCGGGARDPA